MAQKRPRESAIQADILVTNQAVSTENSGGLLWLKPFVPTHQFKNKDHFLTYSDIYTTIQNIKLVLPVGQSFYIMVQNTITY